MGPRKRNQQREECETNQVSPKTLGPAQTYRAQPGGAFQGYWIYPLQIGEIVDGVLNQHPAQIFFCNHVLTKSSHMILYNLGHDKGNKSSNKRITKMIELHTSYAADKRKFGWV